MKVSSESHADQRYIEALLANDHAGIEAIYRDYAGQIRIFVTKNGGTAKDAQDIFQEALMAIYRKAKEEDFKLTCPFGAFLYLVCRGKWLNELRKRRREGVTIEDLEGYQDEKSVVGLSEETRRKEAQDLLFREKFKELSDRCRQLLRLSWKGHSMQEVAGAMDVTYGYARKKKSECIARLTDLIEAAPEYVQLKDKKR